MKIIYVNQCFFTYFLIIFHATRAATHWIVTEDGKIHTQDDSVFQMRRPYDLMSLLQQEKRADVFSKIKSQLLMQKEEIESDSLSDNEEDVEQLVYLTNSDCIRAGKPLVEFDLYVGTLVFAFPKVSVDGKTFPDGFPVHLLRTSSPQSNLPLIYDGNKDLYTIACSNTSSIFSKSTSERLNDDSVNYNDHYSASIEPIAERVKYGPNCSNYSNLDFSMTTFEHLPSIRDRKQLHIEPENSILQVIGKWRTYEEFGKDISEGLKQNSSSWLLYTLASFYWRGAGHAEHAIECARRALHTSPFAYRPIPQLSLATILHRARAFEEAAIVLHGAIDITPDIPHAHYTLGNIYATLTDYNKSVICYENVLKLAPAFSEVKARKAAVLCHANIENALKTQHDNLQKTLEELKSYQQQQELWINYHKKLRAEQAPPSVLLEQRLHYREFKIRQKIESTLDENSNESAVNGGKVSKNSASNKEAAIADALAHQDLLLPTNAKLHIKFNADGGVNSGSLVDKIVIEMDELKNSDELLCELEKHQKAHSRGGGGAGSRKNLDSDPGSSANNESNEGFEDSSSSGGSASGSSTSSNNKQRHVPLGTNSKY